MDALVKTAPGNGNVELQQRERPTIGETEVLLEIAYCGICGSDLHIFDGVHDCTPPVTLGHEFSGTVIEAGDEVSTLHVGDRAGFRRTWSPFPGVDADGGFARYMKAPAEHLWAVPDALSFEEATQFESVRPPMTIVRDMADLQAGEKVVVTGPGPIGLLVTNVASMDGAGHITVLGTDADATTRLPAALELGADKTATFCDTALTSIEDHPPDVWFETSGAAPAIEAAADYVASGGRIVVSGMGSGPYNLDMRRVARRNITIRGRWGGKNEYVEPAADAMIAGDLNVSTIISDILPLADWETGFELARSAQGIKVLLEP